MKSKNQTQQLRWATADETRGWVAEVVGRLKGEARVVVLLSGALGAGKTQVVKWFLEALGIDGGMASSPTFAIHQEYGNGDDTVDHVDLFRVKSDADLESSGFWDLFARPKGLVFVEWADRLPEAVWPAEWKKIFVHLEREGTGEARLATVREE